MQTFDNNNPAHFCPTAGHGPLRRYSLTRVDKKKNINYVRYLPDDARHSIEVERRLPTDVISEDTGQWHANNDACVRAAERKSCQPRAL